MKKEKGNSEVSIPCKSGQAVKRQAGRTDRAHGRGGRGVVSIPCKSGQAVKQHPQRFPKWEAAAHTVSIPCKSGQAVKRGDEGDYDIAQPDPFQSPVNRGRPSNTWVSDFDEGRPVEVSIPCKSGQAVKRRAQGAPEIFWVGVLAAVSIPCKSGQAVKLYT